MKKRPSKSGRSKDNRRAGNRRTENRRPGNPRRNPRSARELVVIYEDDDVVAVNKPSGLPSVPIKGLVTPSAWSLVDAELKTKRQRAFVVHRIDRFTSGVLLFAKGDKNRDILVRQFLAHTPVRQYLAVVRGTLKSQGGTLVHYFRKEGMFQELTEEGAFEATRAELRYAVERNLRGATLVRASLETGLQNQIRVQFSVIGHPVIGDRKYHPEEAQERRINRVALHAAHLEFTHPRSGETIMVDAELPPDYEALIQALALPARPRK
jgi:23S rRNA pseudouridine1911/1915/1917 synthase